MNDSLAQTFPWVATREGAPARWERALEWCGRALLVIVLITFPRPTEEGLDPSWRMALLHFFEQLPPEYPTGASFVLTWGRRTTWHQYPVREIVGVLTIPPNSGAGPGGTQKMSFFIDGTARTLVGMEVPSNGKVGYTEYAAQKFDAALPIDVGVAP